MTEPALETRGLRKRFGAQEVLRGVDLRVERSDLFGFLGQNGAGKTTAIRILARLLRASGGGAALLGRDVATTPPTRLFRGVGFLVETPAFLPYLTGRQNLTMHARLAGIEERDAGVDALLLRFGLAGAADRRVGDYSLGMRQRLGIAQALLADPELLVLDEPTNGLDPGGIVEVREALRREVAERGRTVFLSSHLLSEVEVLCNRVAIIDRGVIVGSGGVAELLLSGESVRLRTSDPARCRELLRERGLSAPVSDGEVRLKGDDAAVARVVKDLVTRGVDVYEVTRERRSLEDVYRDLTGNGA